MLSLNEIRNVHFRKSNFNGYKSEDVEAFIDEVQESYDQLLRENAELQKRVDVLAGKLDEYQHEEDGIRSALINAQKLGDASLRDAKHKAEIILKDATIKAEKIVANAQVEIRREKEIVERMQKDVADFKTNLLKLYKEHLMLINNIRSEEVLRPQTREYANAVHIIDTPFADERYGAPQPDIQDYMQQPANMGYGMDIQQGDIPYGQPMMQPDIPSGQIPVSPMPDQQYGAPQDFQPVAFDMPVKKEPSTGKSNQGFVTDNPAPAPEAPFTTENPAFGGIDYGAPAMQPEQSLSGNGFSVNMPSEPQPFEQDFSAPEIPAPQPEESGRGGFFRRKKRG
ncbi:MAG: DivIVA domain-containing protein [Clostridia bacterium]|nr:DivIVA domain-containing protein [Clostridia bacterium]